MRGVQAGNRREVSVVDKLQRAGWIAGSRRHIAGAGDILAYCLDGREAYRHRCALIEVKSTVQGPYHTFTREERVKLLVLADEFHAEPWLAWWPPGGKLRWIHATEWPQVGLTALMPPARPGDPTQEAVPAGTST